MNRYVRKDHPRVLEATASHRTMKIAVTMMKKGERVLKARGITVILNKAAHNLSLTQVKWCAVHSMCSIAGIIAGIPKNYPMYTS
jgi:hypothetical protein